MSQTLPDWLGASSIDELANGLYPADTSDPGAEHPARKLLQARAERLLLSHEMARVWVSLEGKVTPTEEQPIPLFQYFWVAMNAELLISLAPEPSNSEIKKRYLRLAGLASNLADELQSFASEAGFSPYADVARTVAMVARHQKGEPDSLDLACARVGHELQYRHLGFDNGHFLHAVQVLAEGCLIAGTHRQSRNAITKADSNARMRNEIALVMIRAAHDYLGGPNDESVACTVNAILDLVEDGEAMTGDSVKKLRRQYQGRIFPEK